MYKINLARRHIFNIICYINIYTKKILLWWAIVFLKKNQKGQIAIEFIILLALFLLFFYSMLLPSIEFAEEVVDDTYKIVKTHETINRLADQMESFSTTLGYGKRAIFIYLPGDARITGCEQEINGSKQYFIDANVTISKTNVNEEKCDVDTGECNLQAEFYSGLDTIDCGAIPPGYRGYIVIEKTTAGELKFYVEP